MASHDIRQPASEIRMAESGAGSTSSSAPMMDDSFFGSCDLTSYSYFSLAIALFMAGTVVTIYSMDVGSASMFTTLGHMWLVGPLFVSSGIMVAFKTVLYLRKKNLMAFIVQQRAMLRELQTVHVQLTVTRSPSSITLPPSYEVVVGCSTHGDGQPMRTVRYSGELPPPSYEEAMLLVNGDDQLTAMVTTTTMATTAPADQDRLDDVQRYVLAKDVDG